MDKHKAAKIIIESIIDDICGRSGLQNEWEQIDEDIQQEIIEEWESIVVNTIDNEGM